MAMAAIWFQDSDLSALASSTHWITIFTGLIAVCMVAQAILVTVLMLKVIAGIKDVLATFDHVKGKLVPLIHSSQETLHSVQAVIRDTTPKVKIVTDNLVATSFVVRTTAEKLQATVSDANARTQRQVARVDGMVTAALTTTAELVETINHGIRVPAQKVAVAATQVKAALDSALAKIKSMSGSLPFMKREPQPTPWKTPVRYAQERHTPEQY